jgi:predicted aldo/keto reductase-like oxidoreductase
MERCGVDYFDVYLLHNLGRDRCVNTERFGGFAFLRSLKEQGLVRNI